MTTPLKDIGSLTMSEIGWRRIDGQTLRWVGPPHPVVGGRDLLLLMGRGTGLAITSAYLDPGVEPDDEEAIAEALEDGWPSMLELPALHVLWHSLGTVVATLENALDVTISYDEDDTTATATTEGNSTP